jgi:hypothetical protein
VGVAPGRLSQGPDNVQPPHGKRPCDRDRMEGMSREIGLAGVELAPLARRTISLASATTVGQ